MKFKLDENLGCRGAARLAASGHDVLTVDQQGMSGIADSELFAVCAAEGRVLVTLDFDFSHVLRFPPERSAGVAILSIPGRATSRLVDLLIDQIVAGLNSWPIMGRLWIVEPGRIRLHTANDVDG